MTYLVSSGNAQVKTPVLFSSSRENGKIYSSALFCHTTWDWTQQMHCSDACLLLQVCSVYNTIMEHKLCMKKHLNGTFSAYEII